jgi:hypothetical protein
MKKFLSFFLLALSFNVVYSQTTTYACQFVDSNGFIWKNGKWSRIGFNIDKPFFLKYQDGLLDKESAYRVFWREEGVFAPSKISCVYEPTRGSDSCITLLGQSLVFNKNNLQGATSSLMGAALTGINGVRDTPSIDLFVCQTM